MERELPDNSFASLRAFMSEKLRAGADPSARVLIGAEPGVAYQQVISAMDACVRAGFSNIQFGLSSSAASSVLQDEGTR
jgi:biopolymer transport protein ExbD